MREKFKALAPSIYRKFPIVKEWANRLRERRWFDRVRKRIKGKRNRIKHSGAILASVYFDIIGNDNTIEIGASSLLNSITFYIRGDHHSIKIGEGCRFTRGGSIWFEDSGGRLEIGNGSSFENIHLAITEPNARITIGRDCMFSTDIDVRTGDSHSIIDQKNSQRINYAEDVLIGDHVWVAAHCVILKGVCIPSESIVATGSIVTGKFSQNGIILAGNPARMVREGIAWSSERLYGSRELQDGNMENTTIG